MKLPSLKKEFDSLEFSIHVSRKGIKLNTILLSKRYIIIYVIDNYF